MVKFEINQQAIILGLPDIGTDWTFNGEVVTVVGLPGYNKAFPTTYGVRFNGGEREGEVLPVIPKYLRPYMKKPQGRGDVDLPLTWAQFDNATGLDSSTFRTLDN